MIHFWQVFFSIIFIGTKYSTNFLENPNLIQKRILFAVQILKHGCKEVTYIPRTELCLQY